MEKIDILLNSTLRFTRLSNSKRAQMIEIRLKKKKKESFYYFYRVSNSREPFKEKVETRADVSLASLDEKRRRYFVRSLPRAGMQISGAHVFVRGWHAHARPAACAYLSA